MSMEADLVARLIADAGVAAVAGTSVSWFSRNRADELPALVLSKISPGREWSHSGPDGLDHPRVQFDSYARVQEQAQALAVAVQVLMEAGGDVVGSGGTTRFHPAQLEGELWSDEGEQDGGLPLFRITQDFTFYFEEIGS